MRALAQMLGLSLLTACSTTSRVTQDYAVATSYADVTSERTTLFILVDGLPYARLKNMLVDGRLPHVRDYFFAKDPNLYLGASLFPSLTYPNIAAYLTGLPVDEHGILGNKIVREGQLHDFESPFAVDSLNAILGAKTYFSVLSERGLSSVSVDPYFRAGATAHLHRDLDTGIDYLRGHFEAIDAKSIASLESLLRETPAQKWPTFIFLHLLGVDALSHQYGPDAPEVGTYFADLDVKLAAVLERLSAVESEGHTVAALLSTDHGFTNTPSYFDFEGSFHRAHPEVLVVNEGRFATLTFAPGTGSGIILRMAAEAKAPAGVQAVIYKTREGIVVDSKRGLARIGAKPAACGARSYALAIDERRSDGHWVRTHDFACPDAYDGVNGAFYAPHFVSNLAAYFNPALHPDVLVLAADRVSFAPDMLGQHGGVSAEEVLIPILLRNVTLPAAYRDHPVPTSELLQFLNN